MRQVEVWETEDICRYIFTGGKRQEYVQSIPTEESGTQEHKAHGNSPAEEFEGGVTNYKLIWCFISNYHRTRQSLTQ